MASYDWDGQRSRWQGVFGPALRKVQKQVHPRLTMSDGAVDNLDRKMYSVLAHLCVQLPSLPDTVAQCEAAVQQLLPTDLASWAITEATDAVHTFASTQRFQTEFPVKKVLQLLRRQVARDTASRVDTAIVLYLVAVLDYLAADTLKLAGNYVEHCKQDVILDESLQIAVNADPVLQSFFQDVSALPSVVLPTPTEMQFAEVVREMMNVEADYLVDLDRVIKVFLEVFEARPDAFMDEDIAVMFGNIREIKEFTTSLHGALEEQVENADVRSDTKLPLIGSCLEERAVEHEFDVYEDFAAGHAAALERIEVVSKRTAVRQACDAIDPKFFLALEYELPQLLVVPLLHINHYADVLDLLMKTCPPANSDESTAFRSAASVVNPLCTRLRQQASIPEQQSYLKFSKHLAQQRAARFGQIQRRIEGWDGPDVSHNCAMLLREGTVSVEHAKKRTERYVYVFDGLVVCLKPNEKKENSYRLKEKMSVRGLEIQDMPDSAEHQNAIRLISRDADLVLLFPTLAEKRAWHGSFLQPSLNRLISQILAQKIAEYEQSLPELNPDPAVYPFAQPDSPSCIVFEESGFGGIPVIKGGVLLKLVERLTYPQYVDTHYLREFLTTFRSFCSKEELLDVLMQRFDVPAAATQDKALVKRYTKNYSSPIRLRVLNVLKHWIERHYYDFDSSPSLLKALLQFIKDQLAPDPAMKKAVQGLTNSIRKRRELSTKEKEVVWGSREPPDFCWLGQELPTVYHVLTLHPLEVARQLTLIESELYRAIKPSELVGQMWSKEGKEVNAPHVLALIHRFNRVSQWVKRTIVEAPNLQERTDILCMFLDITQHLLELNNFNGVMELVSALTSASIKRLKFTWADVSSKRQKMLAECDDLLQSKGSWANVRAALRSANPPCLPYFGMYLSDITFIEDGNPDFLPDESGGKTDLINFGKRRLVAKITGDILLYQNQAYCLSKEPAIQHYLTTLSSLSETPIELPVAGASKKEVNAFEELIYQQSLKLEPRSAQDKAELPQADRLLSDVRAQKARREYIGGGSVRQRILHGSHRQRNNSATSISSASVFSERSDSVSSSSSAPPTDVVAPPTRASVGSRPRSQLIPASARPGSMRASIGAMPTDVVLPPPTRATVGARPTSASSSSAATSASRLHESVPLDPPPTRASVGARPSGARPIQPPPIRATIGARPTSSARPNPHPAPPTRASVGARPMQPLPTVPAEDSDGQTSLPPRRPPKTGHMQ
eukprot:m.189296 g.189296  ORF g.189296 m.189296 type:complete len:1239 (+) comp18204_c0_seq4:592-4308(+)